MRARGGDAMHAAHDLYDKTTLDLMKAYGVENFEMAMYESLAIFV